MTDTTLTPTPPSTPAPVRLWQRISPSLVPLLAVLTAMLITIPFMMLTGGEGDFGKGLNIAGTAYSALIEGSLGVVINDRVDRGDLDQFLALAQATDLTQADLRRFGALGQRSGDGRRGECRAITARCSANWATSAPTTSAISPTACPTWRPSASIARRDAPADRCAGRDGSRSDVSDLAEQLAALTAIPPDQRADLLTTLPVIASIRDADLLADMKLVNQYGIVRAAAARRSAGDAARRRDRPVTTPDGALSPDAQQIVGAGGAQRRRQHGAVGGSDGGSAWTPPASSTPRRWRSRSRSCARSTAPTC